MTQRLFAEPTDQVGGCIEKTIQSKVQIPAFNGIQTDLQLIKRAMCIVTDNPARYNKQQGDMMEVLAISVLSTVFPNVRVPYGDDMFSINTSLVINGPSGSMKSLMKYALLMLEMVDDHIVAISKAEHDEWQKKADLWEDHKRKLKKGESVDLSLKPGDEPKPYYLLVPANISKSMLIDAIRNGDKYGIVMRTTETDSFTDANGKEYGKMNDILNKGIVNEDVDKMFRIDGERVKVKNTKLSFFSSGTEDQNHRLISSIQDGLTSRMPVVHVSNTSGYVSQRPNENIKDYKQIYTDLGKEVLDMWKFFINYRFNVVFASRLWDMHDITWGTRFDEVKENISKLLSVDLRFGSYHMRLAATLTMIRLWERMKKDGQWFEDNYSKEGVNNIECSEEDFITAQNIATTVFEHTMLFATAKRINENPNIQDMYKWRWYDQALDEMPEQFPQQEFFDKAIIKYKKSDKTVYRVLAILRKNKRIRRLKTKQDGNVIYKKLNTDKAPKGKGKTRK